MGFGILFRDSSLVTMEGVSLLSEINPLGMEHYNPLKQASDWYEFVTPDEVRTIAVGKTDDLLTAMELIQHRAQDRGMTLVVRDWAHLDWIGFPFVDPPLQLTWQTVFDDPSSVRTCATVRHPVDQYLAPSGIIVDRGPGHRSKNRSLS
jgi:hypothetical protein